MPRRTLAAFDLKAARKVRGLSQMKTAEILCATQPSVARWEAQGNMPEVFRRLWVLYWQLEDARNDAGPNKRAGKSRSRKRTPQSSTRGTDGSDEGSCDSSDEGTGEIA